MGKIEPGRAPGHFLELSGILTGYQNLSSDLANIYYDALIKNHGTDLTPALDEYKTKISEQLPAQKSELVDELLWTNLKFKAACVEIINIWFTSTLLDEKGVQIFTAPPEGYYEALFWKTAQAHPTALSGGYQGYWHYAPEN